MNKFIAFGTKGLIETLTKELKDDFSSRILKTSDKHIFFESTISLDRFKDVKTADDICILLTEKVESPEFIASLDIDKILNYIEEIKKFRELSPEFGITLTEFRNKKIDATKLKSDFIKKIESETELKFVDKFHHNLDFRINIESNRIFLSIKLFAESLFRREYAEDRYKGGLRPTIAAGLVKLLTNSTFESKSIVDNFCGSGTILLEAGLLGMNSFGGDIDPEAVDIAKKRFEKLGMDDNNVKVLDAKNPTWESEQFDYAISNIPWGKKIENTNLSSVVDMAIKEYFRILKHGGKVGILTAHPEMVKQHMFKYFSNEHVVEHSLGFLGQSPTFIIATKI